MKELEEGLKGRSIEQTFQEGKFAIMPGHEILEKTEINTPEIH